MAEEFSLADIVSSKEQAQADRNFYLSMAQSGNAASPIAAYLAGMASKKAAQMSGAEQERKDALLAAQKVQARRDNLINNLKGVFQSAGKREIGADAAATIIGPLFNELGIGKIRQVDMDNNSLVYITPEGEEMEIDFSKWTTPTDIKEQTGKSLIKEREERIRRENELQPLRQKKLEADIKASEALATQRQQNKSGSQKSIIPAMRVSYKNIFALKDNKEILANISDQDKYSTSYLQDFISTYNTASQDDKNALLGLYNAVKTELEVRGESEQPQPKTVDLNSLW